MNKLLAIALAALSLTAAMPTQPELNKAQPLVAELMKPCVVQLRKGEMTPEAVGDKAVEFAAAAETPAAKYLFLKGAVPYYVRAREYDKAADAIESIMSEIEDVPQETLLKLATSATERANAKAAPRLWAIRRRAAAQVKCAAALKTLLPQLRKNRDDRRLVRRYAELTAATGGWEKALKAFAATGGTLGETAQSELDGTATSVALADFWWNYKPLEADAADAIRDRAAFHYRAALDANELDGLALTLAEQRLAQSDPPPAAQSVAAPKVEYKFNYRVDNNDNAILCGNPCITPRPEGVVRIPEKIDGHTVIGVDWNAFGRCNKMTKLVLPRGLQFIEPNFVGDSALSSIEIDSASPNYTSVNGALYSKDKTTLISYPKTRNEVNILPSVKAIGDCAFDSCPFKFVKLPEGIERINQFAFEWCPNLETVYFPKSVKCCGHWLFSSSHNFSKVVFYGDAPSVYVDRGGRNIFCGAEGGIVVEVQKGSKGWAEPNSSSLPERWPKVGNDSRPIRYIK